MKIIIVEDEQRAREGLYKLISSLGDEYEIVAQASNGQVALELNLQLKPDVVFTDIKIPFIDGIKLMSIIRSHNLVTEFIVVSAYGDFELARQSISLDVAEYILKPVVRDDIIHALERVKLRLNGKRGYTPQNSGDLKNKYPDAHPLVLKILDIIQIRYAEKINQKDLAKEIGVSPEYLSYVFSKNIGETFSNFLKKYRIEKAIELYHSNSCDKQQVPYAVGFSDSKYYSQVFRSIMGKTPSEYLHENK